MTSSEDKLQQTAALFRDNPKLTIKQASALLGINEKTIVSQRRKLGLSKKRRKVTDEIRERVFYLSTVEKYKISEIARMTKLHFTTVNQILKSPFAPAQSQEVSPVPSLVNQMLIQQWKRGFHIDSAVYGSQQ